MEDQSAREDLLQDAVASVDVPGVIAQVCRRDSRYRFGAYEWMLAEGLAYTLEQHLRLSKPRHMTGREITEGLRALAIEQFGPLAREVWRQWGVNSTRDWGEIVYNLINAGLLHKHEDDRIEDFNNIYDVDAI